METIGALCKRRRCTSHQEIPRRRTVESHHSKTKGGDIRLSGVSNSVAPNNGKLCHRSRHLAHRQRQHHARNAADDHAHADQDADRPDGTQRPLHVDHEP